MSDVTDEMIEAVMTVLGDAQESCELYYLSLCSQPGQRECRQHVRAVAEAIAPMLIAKGARKNAEKYLERLEKRASSLAYKIKAIRDYRPPYWRANRSEDEERELQHMDMMLLVVMEQAAIVRADLKFRT